MTRKPSTRRSRYVNAKVDEFLSIFFPKFFVSVYMNEFLLNICLYLYGMFNYKIELSMIKLWIFTIRITVISMNVMYVIFFSFKESKIVIK